MKQILYAALPAHPDEQIEFARERGDQLEVLSHRGPFGTSECLAFAPATLVAHFRAPVPARNEKDAARAALYAIEDELAQPVEEAHLILGPRRKGSTLRDIYVADKKLISDWIEKLNRAGLTAAAIVPEQSLFLEIETPVYLDARIIQREGDRIIGVDTALPSPALNALDAAQSNEKPPAGQNLIRLAERSARLQTVSFRTGPFAAVQEKQKGVSGWRKAAGFAIAAISVWTGTLIFEARNFNYATDEMNKRAAQQYSTLFPGAQIPVNIDRATRDMLASNYTPDTINFRIAAANMFEAVTANASLQLKGLSFDGDAGVLTANVSATNSDAIENSVLFLESRGFLVKSAIEATVDGTLNGTVTLEATP
ncbi:hypothetical protein K1X12_12340 [Hyphomonas sp. WL0036]|uniref:type II secretion system protein GspL n=1 Tax=Hyphomonas sediminis TaxID=2866160 RepID=UPI001C826AF8|nr:type II secretion system protein GspL [Hyphomonas sediminis]MBY9067692.1 hypothetical protein [Hyphomonas sediminis]